jgi:hypothetical protein
MSTLSKVLVGLCVVAALVFGGLAIADLKQRQEWTQKLFLYDLAFSGLPLDASSDPRVFRELSDKDGPVLKTLFKTGNPVRTQMEEVERLHAEVRRNVDSQPDEAARRAALQSYLLPLAHTVGRQAAIRDPKTPLDQLNSDLEDEFKITGAQDPKSGQVADLVYNLNLALDPASDRAQVVLGLPAYASAAHRRANALHDLASSVRYAINRDRSDFEDAHQRQVQKIMAQTEILKGLRHSLALRAAERTRWQEEVNKRTLLIQDLEKELAKAREDAAAALREQTRKEQELVTAQRGVAVAQERNVRLENQIRTLERGR